MNFEIPLTRGENQISKKQLEFKLRIFSPSPPYADYRTAPYYVGVENSSPCLHLTKANSKWTKNMNKALSISLSLFYLSSIIR